eukprot:comp19041_c0_seq1/m.21472 comp19041_c0_seq1/g.21472  ORF comp19041_c0_seq1/g.21472 comp19041_c0_seq1/m.21472 type:complete len:284 (-) comp19041_c0_seq1:23-874(-)
MTADDGRTLTSKPSVATRQALEQNYGDLLQRDTDAQGELFLKSFIFALGDGWSKVSKVIEQFKQYKQESGNDGSGNHINFTQASDFLQKNGKARRAAQLKEELKDVSRGAPSAERISLIEVLLLLHKDMVLREYYKRTELDCPYNLSSHQDVCNITGVGYELMEELLTMPLALDPATEKAIEDFGTAQKEGRRKRAQLMEIAAKGGVKGMAAKNELMQLESADKTATNMVELKLNAAKRAAKKQGEIALEQRKKEDEEREKRVKEEGRAKLKARATLWEKGAA